MKLDRVATGHPILGKLKLAAFGMVSRQRAPDVVRVLLYRPELFGKNFATYVHSLLRGASEWTVGERELFAAWVSRTNDCRFCLTSHRVVAERALGQELVEAVFNDLETAPIADGTRAVLQMIGVLVRDPGGFGPEHVRPALDAGVSRDALEQAIHITNAMCIVNLLADGLGFEVPGLAAFERMAGALLRHGYQVV